MKKKLLFLLMSLAGLALSVGAETSDDLTFTVGDVTFKMVKVENGTFQMGSTDGNPNEEPVHQVTLTKDYYIGETEVTQALWKEIMGSNPSNHQDDTMQQLPVEKVSYNDITKETDGFLAKLNAKIAELYTDKTYTFRLPTEAEWEFAARGGNESKGYTYSGSNTLNEVAWNSSNSNGTTHEVAQKKANELGLYDMSGNVLEWCSDWYGDYSSDEAQTDPTGPTTGSYRVDRGGGWNDNTACRSSVRIYHRPDDCDRNLGFRLCLSVSESSAINIGDEFSVDNLTYEVTEVDPAECKVIACEDETMTSVVIPETVDYQGTTVSVTAIYDHAFYKNTELSSVTIPASVTSIGSQAFINSNLDTITCLGVTPPNCKRGTFNSLTFAMGTLIVPTYGGGELYKNADVWNNFVISASGVDGVTVDDNAVEVARYNIHGVNLSAPQSGINIIRMSNGTVHKIIVK